MRKCLAGKQVREQGSRGIGDRDHWWMEGSGEAQSACAFAKGVQVKPGVEGPLNPCTPELVPGQDIRDGSTGSLCRVLQHCSPERAPPKSQHHPCPGPCSLQ